MSCPPGRRTCLGCRAVDDQSALVRVVIDPSTPDQPAVLRTDPKRSLPGRGAWLHPGGQCLSRAVKARAFARAFRRAVDSTALEESWVRPARPDRPFPDDGGHPTNLIRLGPASGPERKEKASKKTDGNPMSAAR